MAPKFIIRIHKEADAKQGENRYWSECVNFPGVFANGRTLKEVQEQTEDALTCIVEHNFIKFMEAQRGASTARMSRATQDTVRQVEWTPNIDLSRHAIPA